MLSGARCCPAREARARCFQPYASRDKPEEANSTLVSQSTSPPPSLTAAAMRLGIVCIGVGSRAGAEPKLGKGLSWHSCIFRSCATRNWRPAQVALQALARQKSAIVAAAARRCFASSRSWSRYSSPGCCNFRTTARSCKRAAAMAESRAANLQPTHCRLLIIAPSRHSVGSRHWA